MFSILNSRASWQLEIYKPKKCHSWGLSFSPKLTGNVAIAIFGSQSGCNVANMDNCVLCNFLEDRLGVQMAVKMLISALEMKRVD
jgi:hypothetical protein